MARSFVLASALAIAGAGCSSSSSKGDAGGGKGAPGDKPATAESSDEVKSLRGQLEEQTRQKKIAEDQAIERERELERVNRELGASRETASKSEAEARLSQEILVQQKKAYEAKIATLLAKSGGKAGVDGTPAAPAETTPSPVAPGEKIPSTPARFKPIDLDVPVAYVDGQPVSRREFCEALYYNYANTYLDTYLNFVLVHREAQRLGIVITDAEAETDALEGLARVEREAGGPDQLNEKLEQMGVTRDSLLDVLRANGRTTATMKKLCLAERDTPEGKARFEKKVRDAYEREFGEKTDARHLFIPVKAGTPEEGWQDAIRVANDLKTQLLAGEDWSAVAKQAREKLKLGIRSERQIYTRATFAAYSDADRAALERAICDGKEGELSEPVRWKGGVSLVKVEKHIPREATFEEKKALIAEDLNKAELAPDEPQQLVQMLRAKAKVEKRLELGR